MKRVVLLIALMFVLSVSYAKDANQALIQAVQQGDEKTVFALLEQKVSPDQKDKDGVPIIVTATKKKYNGILDLLLWYHADPDLAKPNGVTALSVASYDGNFPAVKALVEAKADVNKQDTIEDGKGGFTPLMAAAHEGHLQVVRYLLRHKANPNLQNATGSTALMHAICGGHTDIVVLLLRRKADVNLTDFNGWSPLINASENGYLDIVRILLAAKADVNAVYNKWGENCTALSLAQKNGHSEVVELLKQYGAKE